MLSIADSNASVSEADGRFPMGVLLTTSVAREEPGARSDVDFEVRVVVIDGRHDRRQLMSYVVEQADDVTVVGYADGQLSALEAVDRLGANAVIVEIQLPLSQGLDTISALRDRFPALAIIVCSFHADAATRRDAMARGADAYLVKPLSLRDLRAVLRPVPDNLSGQM
jgi:two-component system, chemotaxis family, protein-glutamate methylesterase/glutaminase